MKHPVFSHLLVSVQFSGVLLCCYPFGWNQRGSAWLLLLCLAGAILGIVTLFYNKIGNFSVYPELKPQASLVTEGPYRWIRHPMYSALILMTAGIALYNGHWLNFIGWALVVLAVSCKASIEELYLSQHFAGFADYRARSSKFIPFLL